MVGPRPGSGLRPRTVRIQEEKMLLEEWAKKGDTRRKGRNIKRSGGEIKSSTRGEGEESDKSEV